MSHRGRRLAGLLLVTTLVPGCAARPVRPQVSPPPPAVSPWPETPVPREARAVLHTALQLVGRPYRDGGNDPRGFDCSGFVQFVFGRHGVALPRTVTGQFASGVPVALPSVRAGDLLFFATAGPGRGVTHVAIALADGRFIHAPSGRGRVRVEPFAGRYWPARFVAARRVMPPAPDPSSLPR